MTLLVTKFNKTTLNKVSDIVVEDVQLVNGIGEHDLHEDDFLFFSEIMGHMFERWEKFK